MPNCPSQVSMRGRLRVAYDGVFYHLMGREDLRCPVRDPKNDRSKGANEGGRRLR